MLFEESSIKDQVTSIWVDFTAQQGIGAANPIDGAQQGRFRHTGGKELFGLQLSAAICRCGGFSK